MLEELRGDDGRDILPQVRLELQVAFGVEEQVLDEVLPLFAKLDVERILQIRGCQSRGRTKQARGGAIYIGIAREEALDLVEERLAVVGVLFVPDWSAKPMSSRMTGEPQRNVHCLPESRS